MDGYIPDELEWLLHKIGPARKIFSYDQEKQIIFRQPQSIGEYKENLITTIKSLEEKQEKLILSVPEYEQNDFNSIKEKFELIDDEEQYERILNQLKRLSIKMDRATIDALHELNLNLKTTIDRLINDVKKMDSIIQTKLSKRPEATAIWVQILAEIQKMLEKKHRDSKEIIFDSKRDIGILSNDIEKFCNDEDDIDYNKFSLLHGTLSSQMKIIDEDIIPEMKVQNKNIDHLENWFRLAHLYQQAFEKSVAIQQNVGTDELKIKYDELSTELKEFLEDQGEQGLKHFERKENDIRFLIKQSNDYISDFREKYNEKKNFFSDQIKVAQKSPMIIRSSFDEKDVNSSYKNLSRECLDIYSNMLIELHGSFLELLTDVEYSKEVLDLSKEIDKKDIKHSINSSLNTIKEWQKTFTEKFFLDDANRGDISFIAEELSAIRDQYSRIRGELRTIQSPKDVSKNGEKLLSSLGPSQSVNLKTIIWELAEKETINLDATLELLKECFKCRQVDIIVKRMR